MALKRYLLSLFAFGGMLASLPCDAQPAQAERLVGPAFGLFKPEKLTKATRKAVKQRGGKGRALAKHNAVAPNYKAAGKVEAETSSINRLAGKAIDFEPVGAVPSEPAGDPGALAKSYCAAIAKPIADAKAKWMERRLKDLEGELSKRIVEINQRIEELREIEARRIEAAKKADENLVSIYAKMKPEAAAVQLSTMDEGTAAALLAKLNTRAASSILSEIPAEKAAKLTGLMSSKRAAALEKAPS